MPLNHLNTLAGLTKADALKFAPLPVAAASFAVGAGLFSGVLVGLLNWGLASGLGHHGRRDGPSNATPMRSDRGAD